MPPPCGVTGGCCVREGYPRARPGRDRRRGRILTADHNTATTPNAVAPADLHVSLPTDGVIKLELHPHSFVTLTLAARSS